MQSRKPCVAIIDDDPFVTRHVARSFTERLPGVDVVGIANPIAPVGFDVYIVDREFGGDSCGQDLVQRIKEISPASLVIVYSAFLDRDYLRALLLESCEGAFDKGSLEELDDMMCLIENFLAGGGSTRDSAKSSKGTVRSILDLVREWNIRLSNSGQASAEYHPDA